MKPEKDTLVPGESLLPLSEIANTIKFVNTGFNSSALLAAIAVCETLSIIW